MKKINQVFILMLILFVQQKLIAQTNSITISSLEKILKERNSSLKYSDYEVKKSDVALKYSKVWDNPNFSYEQDLNNNHPQVKGIGEVIISVEQPIDICGKKHKNYELEKTNCIISDLNYKSTEKDLISELRKNCVDYYFTSKVIDIYTKQINSLQSIVQWYTKQSNEGNVSKLEKTRLQSMLLSVNKDKLEYENQLINLKKNIYLLINFDSVDLSKLKINFDILSDPNLTNMLFNKSKNLHNTNLDILLSNSMIDISNKNLTLQKSNAIPDINLGLTYDRAGSFIPNYVGAILSFDIPLFNHNQTKIKQAIISNLQSQNDYDFKVKTISKELEQKIKTLELYFKVYNGISKDMNDDMDQLLVGINQNFLNRNISMLEFVDYYQTFMDSNLNICNIKKQILFTLEEINQIVGEKIYEY